MEELDIKQLWHAYDAKLERSLQLNHKIIKDMQTQKAENKINAFRNQLILGVVLGTLWLVILGLAVFDHLGNIYFVISASFIIFFNLYAVIKYAQHAGQLYNIDLNGNITQAQEKLAAIQLSGIDVGRILILQTPFYCTFWYNDTLVAHAGTTFWLIQLIVVSLFIILSVAAYRLLNYRKARRTWVKNLIKSFGGTELSKAIDFLDEIEDYKTGI
ncbi:hypothetical protein GCM10023149_10830 [Mucilaginibacter gynuensis]|uniref:Uncharacterized protein n=1 Tax=Mucilaginibacter gynuensis TaxID=1302236 RepID=A0ABP8G051_9SPHI